MRVHETASGEHEKEANRQSEGARNECFERERKEHRRFAEARRRMASVNPRAKRFAWTGHYRGTPEGEIARKPAVVIVCFSGRARDCTRVVGSESEWNVVMDGATAPHPLELFLQGAQNERYVRGNESVERQWLEVPPLVEREELQCAQAKEAQGYQVVHLAQLMASMRTRESEHDANELMDVERLDVGAALKMLAGLR